MYFTGGIINILKNMLQKKLLKNLFYEKVKMLKKKGPFVVETFITISSFDYDCTQPSSVLKLDQW
jgi:hypothetical protein